MEQAVINQIEQPPQVLLVDDTEQVRESIKAILKTQQIDIHEAVNGKEGIVKAREIHPDLILLDVMMPEMDGFEACKIIRKDPSVKDIPIVMVTALDDKESRLKGIEAGADDFLNKPIDPHEFRARVKTILRLNRYKRLKTHQDRLEASLDGTITLLMEILQTLKPDHFKEGPRVFHLVKQICKKLRLKKERQLLQAAMLWPLGTMNFPIQLLEKIRSGERLHQTERIMYEQFPESTKHLLHHIPEFKEAGNIASYCLDNLDITSNRQTVSMDSHLFLGHLIKICTAFDREVERYHSVNKAIETLLEQPAEYNPKMVKLLDNIVPLSYEETPSSVTVGDLTTGMMFEDDVSTKDGTLIVKRGEVANSTLLEKILTFDKGVGINEPIKVFKRNIN